MKVALEEVRGQGNRGKQGSPTIVWHFAFASWSLVFELRTIFLAAPLPISSSAVLG